MPGNTTITSTTVRPTSRLRVARLPLCGRVSPVLPTAERLEAACAELSAFVLDAAEHTAREVGFGWVGTADAPDTGARLKAAYAHAAATGEPLPVSSENLTSTIYTSREADVALRFWHDVNHVRRGYGFGPRDELQLGLWHVAVAEAEGLSPLAVQLLEADMVGQTLLYAATKLFAVDQRQFDVDVLTFGIADAILLEAERHDEPTNEPSSTAGSS